MSEKLHYLKGANLGILLAIVLSAALGGCVILGPARAHLDRLRVDLDGTQEQLATWQSAYSRFRPIPVDERAVWHTRWLSLGERLKAVRGDAELMALVADGIQTGSVHGLQVSRRQSESMAAPEAESEALLVMPIGDGEPFLARPEPVRVTLAGGYEDARRIIERLETHQLPARLDAIEMKRDFPDIWMQLDLVYFVRAEPE